MCSFVIEVLFTAIAIIIHWMEVLLFRRFLISSTYLFDHTVKIFRVFIEFATHLTIVKKSVLAPILAVDPTHDFIDIGLGLIWVNGHFNWLTHLVQMLKELREEWTWMNVHHFPFFCCNLSRLSLANLLPLCSQLNPERNWSTSRVWFFDGQVELRSLLWWIH